MVVKEAADGRQTLHCTASSSEEDLHGDTMTAECVRDMATQAKAKGLTIFLNHKYNIPEDVFGVVTDSAVVSRAENTDGAIWDMDLDIELAGTNDRVPKTYALIKTDKVKLGVSIGAFIEDYDFKDEKQGFWGGLIINKVNLVEASIVGIPANQRSWVQNAVLAIKGAMKGSDMDDENDKILLAGAVVPIAGIVDVPEAKAGEGALPIAPATPPVTSAADGDPSTTEPEAAAPEATGDASGDETAQAESGEPSSDEQLTETAPQSEPASVSAEATTGLLEVTASAFESALETLRAKDVEIATLNQKVKDAEAQRDQATQLAEAAAEIIERIANTPLGRKAVVEKRVDDFKSIVARTYGDKVASYLE